MKLRDANLQVYEKNSVTYPPSCILPSFPKNLSQLLLPKRFWKCVSKISFRKYKQKLKLLVIYLFNYDSSKSTSFIMNVAFDGQVDSTEMPESNKKHAQRSLFKQKT